MTEDEGDVWNNVVQKVTAIATNPVRPAEPEGALLPFSSICRTCLAPIDGVYTHCWACNQHRDSPHAGQLADLVVPLSYAVKRSQYYSDLWSYKGELPSKAALERLQIMILLFGINHWGCLQERIGKVDLITSVPSGHGRSPHPLERVRGLLHRRAPIIDAAYVAPLRSGRAAGMRPGDFRFQQQPLGHLVIVEDTWVQGNNAQALAVRAKQQGASRVSIVVLGRVLDLAHTTTKVWVDAQGLKDRPYDPYECPVGLPGCRAANPFY